MSSNRVVLTIATAAMVAGLAGMVWALQAGIPPLEKEGTGKGAEEAAPAVEVTEYVNPWDAINAYDGGTVYPPPPPTIGPPIVRRSNCHDWAGYVLSVDHYHRSYEEEFKRDCGRTYVRAFDPHARGHRAEYKVRRRPNDYCATHPFGDTARSDRARWHLLQCVEMPWHYPGIDAVLRLGGEKWERLADEGVSRFRWRLR